jgi:hypothetical protein
MPSEDLFVRHVFLSPQAKVGFIIIVGKCQDGFVKQLQKLLITLPRAIIEITPFSNLFS